MKYSLVLLALTTSALTAPTKVEERQLFPGLGSSGSSGSSSSGISPSPYAHVHIMLITTVGGSTENGVTDNKECQPLTFIFARGTSEMGNMGSVVGPPVAKQLASLTSDKVTVQGVDYPADAAVLPFAPPPFLYIMQ